MTTECFLDILFMLQLSFREFSLLNWRTFLGFLLNWFEMTCECLFNILLLLALGWWHPRFFSDFNFARFLSDLFFLLGFDLLLDESSFLGRLLFSVGN